MFGRGRERGCCPSAGGKGGGSRPWERPPFALEKKAPGRSPPARGERKEECSGVQWGGINEVSSKREMRTVPFPPEKRKDTVPYLLIRGSLIWVKKKLHNSSRGKR